MADDLQEESRASSARGEFAEGILASPRRCSIGVPTWPAIRARHFAPDGRLADANDILRTWRPSRKRDRQPSSDSGGFGELSAGAAGDVQVVVGVNVASDASRTLLGGGPAARW